MRLTRLLLHRQYRCGHHERDDPDVQPGPAGVAADKLGALRKRRRNAKGHTIASNVIMRGKRSARKGLSATVLKRRFMLQPFANTLSFVAALRSSMTNVPSRGIAAAT